MTKLPLTGVRVADFCWVGAGSYMTKLLADSGAEVIKIESSARLDAVRLTPPFKDGIRGVDRSGYFADRNTSKRSVTINMKTSDGQALARRLISQSDVVANNFTPRVMKKFGLSYEEVREFNPGIVYVAMSMQGTVGPDRDYLGFGQTIAALVGFHHLTGVPNRPPVGTGTNYPDHVPNPTHAAFATIAALRHRRRTGRGQYIDMAQTEPTVGLLGASILDYTVNGRDSEAIGNGHRRFAPQGVYQCAGDDEWIAISVTDDRQWPAFTQVLDLPEAQWPRQCETEAGRHHNRERLDAVIATAVAGRDASALATELLERGVPAGRVASAADVMSDPQLVARGHWVRLDHPEMGKTAYNGTPFALSRTPARLSRAPMLGEHTREVCREYLDLDDREIDRLTADGVLV
ncbi:CoA transferase [Nocardioides sp. KIGAM211]|uniref:CoA transferase n=1 Tax=Nocardioides luti TaxID=2761101 RepID=A0A7X0RHP1_9ACTN|nr:CoA transferase [Nocardioides luti]MBB6627545.1 CoA transferase [Nocardioides luti]